MTHPDQARNWSFALQRVKAYARSASEAASAGDFDAALIALDLIEKLCNETATALRAEQARRLELERANG